MVATSNAARLDLNGSTVVFASNVARLDLRASVGLGLFNRIDAIAETGTAFYARNITTSVASYLGFSADGTLTDVSLANGTYEIEARTSRNLWDEARTRKVTTVVIATGAVSTSGLPAIQNLAREIVSEESVIEWNISEEFSTTGVSFGLWFSATSPVSTAGDPDITVDHLGIITNNYIYTYTQTANRYVAVAAITDTDVGPSSELYMSWDTSTPSSPGNVTIE